MQPERRSVFWMFSSGAFWFAQSFKWFVLLLLTIPEQVAQIVPPSEKNSALGLVLGVGAMWAAIGPFVFGWLSYHTRAKIGRHRQWLSLGASLTVLGLFAMGIANSIPMMIGAYLLLQIADDMGTGPYAGLIAEKVPVEQRGKASSVLGLLRFGAQVVGGIFGGVMAKNPAGVYIGVAIVNVICALITMIPLRKEEPYVPESGQGPNVKDFVASFLTPWKTRDFTLVFIVSWVGNLGFYLVQTYLKNFLEDRIADFRVFGTILDLGVFKVDSAGPGVMFLGLMISLIAAIGAGLNAGLIDRIGRKRSVFLGGCLMAAPLVPFAIVPNFTLTVVLAPVFALGLGFYMSASWALVSDVLPDRERLGKDMGIWQAAQSSVQIGSGIVGSLIDALNRVSFGSGYSAMFLIGGAMILLGAVLARRISGSS